LPNQIDRNGDEFAEVVFMMTAEKNLRDRFSEMRDDFIKHVKDENNPQTQKLFERKEIKISKKHLPERLHQNLDENDEALISINDILEMNEIEFNDMFFSGFNK
jgi:hypothetical protein